MTRTGVVAVAAAAAVSFVGCLCSVMLPEQEVCAVVMVAFLVVAAVVGVLSWLAEPPSSVHFAPPCPGLHQADTDCLDALPRVTTRDI